MAVKKELIFVFLGFLLLSSFAYAYDLRLTLETSKPQTGVVVRVKDLSDNIIDSVYSTTGNDGFANINYTTNKGQVHLSILLVYDGEVKEYKDFYGIDTNGDVFLSFFGDNRTDPRLNVIPEDKTEKIDNVVNDSESDVTNTTEVKENVIEEASSQNNALANSSITGRAIMDLFSSTEDSVFYIGLGILAILVIVVIIYFFIALIGKKKGPVGPSNGQIKEFSKKEPDEHIKKAVVSSVPNMIESSNIKETIKQEFTSEDDDPEIVEAKRKIAELESQIKDIRKKEELMIAQRKFERAQRELERLRNDRSDGGQNS